MQLGNLKLSNALAVAPMAGVTDKPWRQLCRRLGAGYAVGEMVTSRPDLMASGKTMQRTDHAGESGPVVMQIVGTDPVEMAHAAAQNIDRGAQVVDINMGCPVKKVCSKWAGSALMQNEPLAVAIVRAVVAEAEPHGVAVTVKMRTGWSRETRNAARLATLFEDAGARMLTVHGRTRDQRFHGQAEYDTIAQVKSAVRIPVLANGDVDSPAKACQVLRHTGADGVMIGRAALGRPWLFQEVRHFLETGQSAPPLKVQESCALILRHLQEHYEFHGEYRGVRTARKHIAWYVQNLPGAQAFRERINQVDDCLTQSRYLGEYLAQALDGMTFWPTPAAQTSGHHHAEEVAA